MAKVSGDVMWGFITDAAEVWGAVVRGVSQPSAFEGRSLSVKSSRDGQDRVRWDLGVLDRTLDPDSTMEFSDGTQKPSVQVIEPLFIHHYHGLRPHTFSEQPKLDRPKEHQGLTINLLMELSYVRFNFHILVYTRYGTKSDHLVEIAREKDRVNKERQAARNQRVRGR